MAQTGKNIVVAFKVEATANTAPGASSGTQLRLTPSPGLSLQKELIRSAEVRSDGLSTIPRHGSRRVGGSYSGEMSVGSHDEIYQALFRATAVAAVAVTAATASLMSLVFGTNTVEAASTGAQSWHAAGVRVGDVFRISGHATNSDINARVKSMTTHTLTVHGTAVFTADASPDTTFTVTVGKKLTNPTTPVRRTFYIDEYNKDIDLSEVFGGCRWTSMRLRGSPNGMAEVEFGVMGMSATGLATGASPYYTSPTQFTTVPLVFADAKISFGGSDILTATGFELMYALTADTLPVIGSSVTPDVFDNDARLSGSLTVLREDLTNLSRFADETELELHILLEEPESAPKDYIGLYVPKLKITNLDAALGSDGAMLSTLSWEAGVRASATNYDGTLLTMITSAT